MNRDNLRNFHVTDPFGNDAPIEDLSESTMTKMLSELMSDYVSNTEQNAEITAAAEQPSSSPASPNSTNLLDSAENATQGKTWPLLEVTDYTLKEWSNSNTEQISGTSTAEKNTSQDRNETTPIAAPRTPSTHRNPLGSIAKTSSADRNPFLNACAQQAGPTKTSNNRDENPPARVEENSLRFLFKTPPRQEAWASAPELLTYPFTRLPPRPVQKHLQIQLSQKCARNHRRSEKIFVVVSLNSPKYTHD